MLLKSLELHGFKSFPNRTVLKFSGGTTVVVGPNGSGKSNITDAMRWVLGELSSKNIRGSKMEDVVFAGSDDVKPMSFAQVAVTFDDSQEPRSLKSPYDEVTVTRRYYRSGESEYFINGKKCRLRDIYELFMNTGIGREGYSIIGQGKISEIISKKSEDRRGIFEESAGIARFRYQKSEAEKKLTETMANMERVADIEAELASRIGPLEKEAEKARRYLELYAEKKKTDVSLWLYDAEKLKSAVKKSTEDTALSAHELEMAEDSLRVTASSMERLYEQSRVHKENSRRNRDLTEAAVKRLNEAESGEKLLEKEKQHAEDGLQTEIDLAKDIDADVTREQEKLDELKKTEEEIDHKLAEAERQAAEYAEKLAKLDRRIREWDGALNESFTRQKDAENRMTDLRVRLNVLENSILGEKKRSESIDSDLGRYGAEIAQCEKICRDAQAQMDAYRTESAKIAERLADAEAKAAALREEAEALRAEERKRQAASDSCDSRIAALTRMQEHFDGYNNSVRYVMGEAKAGRLPGIRGPLSTLISVKRDYITAVETSLGAALQYIVTDDEAAAKNAIEALKRSGSGRATFYPVTTVRAAERGREYSGVDRAPGFIGWGDELTSSAPEYRAIVQSLLARLAVFDTLAHASDAARAGGWRIRAVTLDGQQVNAGGSFTGGAARRDSGMLSRSLEIDTLNKERSAVLAELEAVRVKLREREGAISALTNENAEEAERKQLLDVLAGGEEKTFADADSRRKALAELTERMRQDALNLSKSSSRSAEETEKIRKLIDEAREEVETIRKQREELGAERGKAELEAGEIGESANETKVRLAELKRDREAADHSIRETEERAAEKKAAAEAHREKAERLKQRISELDIGAKEKEKTAGTVHHEIEALAARQKELDEAVDETDAKLAQLRRVEQEQTSKKELVFIAHSKNQARLASLKEEERKSHEKLWEDYELTWAGAVHFAEENGCHTLTLGERAGFASLQSELRGKIKALGHVNPEAVDEYAEVKARYEKIRTQLGDLRASREDLEAIIKNVEGDMKTVFMEAFTKINTYFGEVFRELFGGGHAEVILTDPDNVLDSGIEINAAPPGKTIKNLSLLSGGEQAFIAIALLFALVRVNPSPFCIFDEIEAALDEMNVSRVGRYIRNLSKSMQIIMISHRRGTMDIADTLYGVTMQKSGVSSVFTLGTGDDRETWLK